MSDQAVGPETSESATPTLDLASSGVAAPPQPLEPEVWHYQIRTPRTYGELRRALTSQLAWRVERARAPGLVDASNLLSLASRFNPGERVVVTMRMIPGENRFESVHFSLPEDHVTEGPGIEVPGQVPAMRCEPTESDPLDPGRSRARQLAIEVLSERYNAFAAQPGLVDQLWTPSTGFFEYFIPTSTMTSVMGRGQATRAQLAIRGRPGSRAIEAAGHTGYWLFQPILGRVACGREGPSRPQIESAIDEFVGHAEAAKALRATLITQESDRQAMAGSSMGNFAGYFAFERENILQDHTCMLRHLGV